MDERAFINEQNTKISFVEMDLAAAVQKVKNDVEKEIQESQEKTDSNILKVRKNLSKELKEISDTISTLQSQVNRFKNNVYSKYFEKVSVIDGIYNSRDSYGIIQENIESALRELRKYEHSIRVQKFLVDLFRQSIRNACQQIVNSMDKLNDYLRQRTIAIEEKISKRAEELKLRQQKKEFEIRSAAWRELEMEIKDELSKVLSEIIGE